MERQDRQRSQGAGPLSDVTRLIVWIIYILLSIITPEYCDVCSQKKHNNNLSHYLIPVYNTQP